MSARSTLRVPRIRQRVLVARDHPDPERVRRQMHDALTTHLGDALAAIFEQPRSARDDDAVWRIRHLAVDVSVNAGWDAPSLARAWASQLAQAVRRAMDTGSDGVTVMRFENRAAYVGAFLTEVADGTAWSRWWFDEFRGMRLLSRSATVKSTLLRDVAIGLAALHSLRSAVVAHVIEQLTVADARVVLDAMVMPLGSGDAANAVEQLLAAHGALDAPMPRSDSDRWCLRLIVEALRSDSRHTSRSLGVLARALARLARLGEEGAARVAIVRRLLADGNVNGLRVVLSSGDAECLAPLARAGTAMVDAAFAHLIVADTLVRTATVDDDTMTVYMPVAAPLLLAPLAAAMPFDEITRGWPAIGGEGDPPDCCATSAAILRLLAIASACGGERASRVIGDDTARLIAGVGSAVSSRQLSRWVAARSVSDAARLEFAIGAWRARNAMIGNRHWLLASDAHDDAISLVLVDCMRGCWLAVREDADARGKSALNHWLGAARSALLVDEHAQQSDEDVVATLARRDRIGGELRWLALPKTLGVPRAFELALASVAQGMLRDLAWRLPGFARASLPHLWTNFLAVDAQLEHTPTQITACVNRPPLAMIASMAGLLRARYRLPWLGERAVALYPADVA